MTEAIMIGGLIQSLSVAIMLAGGLLSLLNRDNRAGPICIAVGIVGICIGGAFHNV